MRCLASGTSFFPEVYRKEKLKRTDVMSEPEDLLAPTVLGAFPIFCKCSWSWGKTTLTGFQTLSGLTLLYVLLKHGGSHKKSGMHPYKTSKPISKERAQDTLSDAVYFVNAIMKYLEDDMKKS
ncbi:hypothetical protein [Candidatus Kuenenia stuttgartiensis]|uniref:hypothetical protein n=1 Tax=Kuenenia stuttgartiensis TaxID=174633 RepID=UPI0012FEA7B0|nr:hypothetical protein [Candidatus Kuenenia stuttgartiensis]